MSGSTRRRDQVQKRTLYLDASVEEYWIVDPEGRRICRVRDGESDEVASDRLAWLPTGALYPLTWTSATIFGELPEATAPRS